jgi:hypothetical protein
LRQLSATIFNWELNPAPPVIFAPSFTRSLELSHYRPACGETNKPLVSQSAEPNTPMGDKSPKSNQKKSTQKQVKATSSNQKKQQAVASKATAGKKK